jgi:site-specific recombinase XerD
MKTLKTEAREQLKAEYRSFLSRRRGLASKTSYKYATFIDRFLDFRFEDDPDDLLEITAHDVAAFLHHVTGQAKPFRDKSLVSVMRSIFQFFFQTEKIAVNLASGIPSVKQNYARRIPRHLAPEQVEDLLLAVKTFKTSSHQKRNYAMVLLMARLGLRGPEVIAIQLEDIDWRAGEILIRGKGGYHDKTPLLNELGQAIADYIRQERKGTSRTLFVTNHSPYMPFKDAQVLNTILLQALKKTSIPLPKRYTIINMLRHSLATNLVHRGASLEEISNTLRHRSRNTSLLYARQDIDGLRTIALSWPLTEGDRI